MGVSLFGWSVVTSSLGIIGRRQAMGVGNARQMCLEVGHEIMGWSEVLSIVAVVVAVGSLVTSYRGYRIAAFQALPHPRIGWESSTTGHRSLYFRMSLSSGDPDWVVAGVSVRGNWRRRCYLAHGVLEHAEMLDGQWIESYQPTGSWQRCIVFDPPLIEGAVVLHPEAPDCEVKLKLTLSTTVALKLTR